MVASSPIDKALTKSQHQFFLIALSRLVGELQAAVMVDGQLWEQTYSVGGTQVALSDTSRNTKTDKKGTSHSHGIYTLEFITTDEQHQGQGAASRQLKVLCQLADRWSITLRVRVLAHETSRLNDEQLTAWYQRYHFTEVDGLYLNRLPAQRRPK